MLRIPFFGLISARQPWEKLRAHYDKIAEGMKLIEDALECYVRQGGECPEFQDLAQQVHSVEDEADKIKRNIRNHLPMGLFMPVDKTIFFNYTRSQDNILDDAESALNWLVMRPLNISEEHKKKLAELLEEVLHTVTLLQPALDSTINLLQGQHYDRQGAKETYRAVRSQHQKVWRLQTEVLADIYNADMDFKDLLQLSRYVEQLGGMSHNTEACADLLRAMIAK